MNKLSLLCLLSLTLGITSLWAGTISTNPNAFQDSVDWCQFGCSSNQLSSPQAWSSAAGNTGLVGNATTQDFQVLQQGATWNGNFAAGMGFVYNGAQTLGNTPGTINVLFDQAVYGVGAYIQNNFYGVFTGTITLLDGNLDPLGSFSANGSSDTNVGTALFLGAFDPTADVWGAIFSTNDNDFGIGQLRMQTAPAAPPIPEPSTLLLVAPSLLGLAAAARRRLSRSSQEVM